ncbi:MFS transporter [Paenibacillus rhizoplanae]
MWLSVLFPKIDITSVALSTIGFGTLLYGFSRAASAGWSSAEVLLSLAAGVISLGLFIWKQLKSESPLLDLRAFQYNMFSLTTVISVAVTIVMYADMMLLPLYLQNARGFTAMESGLLLMPGAVIMGALMPITGKLFDRFGAKWLAIIGLTITILTTFSFVNLTDSTSYGYLMLMSTGRRIGMALLLMPIQTLGLNQLPLQAEFPWYSHLQYRKASRWRSRYFSIGHRDDQPYCHSLPGYRSQRRNCRRDSAAYANGGFHPGH